MIENQQSATDDRRGACFFVESKTDGALIKVTGCNDTDERQNWAYTMKGQIMVSSIVIDIIHVAILKDGFFAANLVTSRFRVEN